VVKRKNKSLEELARTLLNEIDLPKYFWADALCREILRCP